MESDDRDVYRNASAGGWFGFQADVHRRVAFLPRFENGRRILPDLHEMPIIGFLDEDLDDVLDGDEMDLAVYARCLCNSDDLDHEVLVRIDHAGATVH